MVELYCSVGWGLGWVTLGLQALSWVGSGVCWGG